MTAEGNTIDPSILKKADVVHYYGYAEVEGKLTSVVEVGTVKEDNIYKDGVDVHGDGWRQYVGKWFIVKVERDGKVLFEQGGESDGRSEKT